MFKLSLMGNDPHTALVIAIGERLGVDFSVIFFVANCVWFSVEWRFGKDLIGIGTFVNWFFVGALASLCEKAALSVWKIPEEAGPRMCLMLVGVVMLSLAWYMTPSAAEAQGVIRADKHPKSTRYGRQNPTSKPWNNEEQLILVLTSVQSVLLLYGSIVVLISRSHHE